jgi:uncharacterized protein YxeA
MKKRFVIAVIVLIVVIGVVAYFYHSEAHLKNTNAAVPISTDTGIATTAQPLPNAQLFSGQYNDSGYGNSTGDGNGVTLYADSPTTILFYLDLYQGGNIGELYDRATETAPGVFTYYSKNAELDTVCNFTMTIKNNVLTLASVDGDGGAGCEFGEGVVDDGTYTKTNAPAPQYFEDGSGTNVYFKTTPPEKYQE